MEACPKDAPVELSDGTIIKPEDSIRLKDLCEIVPLILETIAGQNAQGKSGRGHPRRPGAAGRTAGRARRARRKPVHEALPYSNSAAK